MPHSGFGATLNPDQLQKFDPPPPSFFRHSNFFLLNDLLGSPLMNIYGSDHGPSAVVYHALRNFFISSETLFEWFYFEPRLKNFWVPPSWLKIDLDTKNVTPSHL